MGASDARFLFRISGKDYETRVVDFNAVEGISSTFEVNVTLASESKIAFDDVAGLEALLTLGPGIDGSSRSSEDTNRYFHGIINKFKRIGDNGDFHIYRLQVVPALWLLTLERDCRTFQKKTVREIVSTVLEEGGIRSDRYRFALNGKYPEREYCNQYRETDFNFISRLLEEEGIFYFFEHSKDKHVLVFTDNAFHCVPLPGSADIPFGPPSGFNPDRESISAFNFSQRIRPGAFTHTSFNEERPSLDLKSKREGNLYKNLEVYDYAANYETSEKGTAIARIRLEEQKALKMKARGQSSCPRLVPGCKFNLTRHDYTDFNKEYLIAAVAHSGDQPQSLDAQAGGGGGYENAFICLPGSVKFRPARITPKPVVTGLQTAIVVGPQGEEIHPEKYAQVKVQFHWDRRGKRDDKSSCWIRAGQMWGGAGWGSQFLPRVGDEVLVAFMEGDPDQPIIVGSVYNENNQPLYDLEKNKTQSGIRTRSYPKGEGFNELRFEDKLGEEHIYLQGEKDWNILIKNDKGQNVGHDETLAVANNRTKTVGANQSETIGANKDIQVGSNHTETIGANMSLTVAQSKTESVGSNASLSVGGTKTESVALASAENVGGAKAVTVGGALAFTVAGAMNTAVGLAQAEEVGLIKKTMVGKSYDITAGDSFKITCGRSSIQLNKDGTIEINGTWVSINGSSQVAVAGEDVEIAASYHIQINGDTDIN
jgi:type VI secretion system secreted protein VgrG